MKARSRLKSSSVILAVAIVFPSSFSPLICILSMSADGAIDLIFLDYRIFKPGDAVTLPSSLLSLDGLRDLKLASGDINLAVNLRLNTCKPCAV